MAKIDLDKFVVTLLEYEPKGEEREFLKDAINKAERRGYFPYGTIKNTLLRAALREQGLICENGQIKECKKHKYKVGDFVKHLAFPKETYQVVDIDSAGDYELVSVDGNKGKHLAAATEEYVRLWTIQDAQNGDFLVATASEYRKTECPFIFKEIDKDGVVRYHAMLENDSVWVDDRTNVIGKADSGCYKPATKEQIDNFRDKIADSLYYSWDSEEKKIIIKKQELTTFEERLRTVLERVWQHGFTDDYEVYRTVKKFAPELMQIARDEIMKDMPRWRHCEPSFFSYTENSVSLEMKKVSHMGITTSYDRLRKGNYYIPIVELDKLPKEK